MANISVGQATQKYAPVQTSFSGADMTVVIGGRVAAMIQGLSFSVTREKAPLYTMGSPDPRAFSRGKRGISGSLIFLFFNASPLPDMFGDGEAQFIARNGEYSSYSGTVQPDAISSVTAAVDASDPRLDHGPVNPWYADQMPPFNIVVRAVNEYGHAAQMEIHGVEILNTGSGISVDDITIDESHTYVARKIKRWYKQKRWNGTEFADVTELFTNFQY